MRIFLHTCCGPCSIYPYRFLREAGHDVTGFFYNPNIHPYKEFQRRLDTLKEYAAKAGMPLVVDDDYALEEFLRQVVQNPWERCRACYRLRLTRTAAEAKARGYDGFSTTLLVSPYQKHDRIREAGEEAAQTAGIPFYYVDFRPGWPQGVAEAKALGLYRQPYCGCVYSEKERYYKRRLDSVGVKNSN